MRRDNYRGFIPRRVGAVKTAPQHMEALRVGRPTLNEARFRGGHDLSRGFIPPRIGAVETAPQPMKALRAGHATLNESGLPDFAMTSGGCASCSSCC